MKIFGLELTGCQKCSFSIFAFFIFSNFKWLLPKILWKNHPFFKMVFGVFMKFYYVTNIFDSHTFDNKTTALLKLFKISTENGFCFFIFSKWKKNCSLIFNDTLKCAVVHYCNLNSSSINKLYLRAVENAISVFSIFYLCLF